MRYGLIMALLPGYIALLPAHSLAGGETSQHAMLEQEAMSLVKRFAGELKPRLKKALQEGGPVHAIEICADAAPTIAKQISEESGWLVKRVSLKARNYYSAIPDAWETAVLKQFETRLAGGEAISTMCFSEKTGDAFRFMKPQAVEPVCLNCHGQELSDEVSAALGKHYPDDSATGYTLGQIRGAFSLSKSTGK
jgi:hypothetical protein